tara:strand:+ start:93 stop:530 length:438 start_codon:yes stop_codon:yes gene_type:complete
MAAPIIGLARLLLSKGFRDAAKKQFKKAGKALKEDIKVKITQPGPLKGKNVDLKDLRKLSISSEIKKQLKPTAGRDKFSFGKVDSKTGRIISMSNPKKLIKQTKDAREVINKLNKQIGNIEKKYVTKQAKGGLIRGLPKLAKRGF